MVQELSLHDIGGIPLNFPSQCADIIRLNTTLRSLDISRNNITFEGGCLVAESLKVNTTLEDLGTFYPTSSLACKWVPTPPDCAFFSTEIRLYIHFYQKCEVSRFWIVDHMR